ncbi:MAG: energy-coupling factor transporter transmembrane protein EcfT [Clostridiales bacterium]|nr:energy-coupling factor transporter transmembrane protein EcfT [Clostridiales bacterium]
MLKDITIGQYYPGKSIIHRLDPRTKLVITFLFIFVIFFIRSYTGYLILLVYLAAAVIASALAPRLLIRGIKPLRFILILTFIINVFFTAGEDVIISIWRIKVTSEGLNQAIFMALRLVFLVMATSVLTLTTSPIELTDGLEYLLKPLRVFKFPAHELAMMMTIALRFIPTLMEETDKIMKAQMARGADFDTGNLIQRAKSLIPLLVPLFISAFRRADELAMAMEARCYRGGENRTRMKVLKVERRDYIAIYITIIMVFFIMLDRYFL